MNRQDLELRYDGPIPKQHIETDATQRRRILGTVTVFERQMNDFLDAAERALGDLEDMQGQLLRITSAYERSTIQIKLAARTTEYENYISYATDAFQNAIRVRAENNLPANPIFAMVSKLADMVGGQVS